MSDAYLDLIGRKERYAPAVGFHADVRDPWLYPFQRHAVSWALAGGRRALFEDTGLGKAQPVDEPVLTPSGWRQIGDLVVGDLVIAGDGTPTKVMGVFPQGVRPVHEVRFNDGARVRCDAEHLWNVATDLDLSRGVPWRTLPLSEIESRGLACPDGRARWRVPMPPPVQLTGSSLPIDPYVLGCLLGDGCLRRASVELTSADPELVARVGSRLPEGVRPLARSADLRSAPAYRLARAKSGCGNRNPIMEALETLGLRGRLSQDKFIPELYLLADVTSRLEMVRGLLDTDGYVSADGTVQFSSSSRALVDGVTSLVRSLGGTVRESSKIPTYRHRGELRTGLPHWTLTLAWAMDEPPVTLPRKVERFRLREKYAAQRKIVEVVDAGTADCVCIAVAHHSQLYVTRDFVVTHNTRQQLAWSHHVARHTGGRVLVLAPLAVGPQTAREASNVGLDGVIFARNPGDAGTAPVVITNYDNFEKFAPADFAGVVLDESSILKSFTGAIKTGLCEAFARTPFRLCCTATPAPNDHLELGNHAEFLGILSSHQMIARWFINDTSQMGTYRLKGHAVTSFWDWVASWAICAGLPSDLGPYSDEGYVLPELRLHRHVVDVDIVTGAGDALFRSAGLSATTVHQEKRRTAPQRAARVAELVAAEPDEPWLVWCDTDYEADALLEVLPDHAVEVSGSMSPEVKSERLLGFADRGGGLVTKAKIAGFGMNWQHCAKMAFVGSSYSYEAFYQAVRRSWRFGQRRPVDAHVIMAFTEQHLWEVVAGKAEDHADMKRQMFAAARRSQSRHSAMADYHPTYRGRLPAWLVSSHPEPESP